MGVSVRPRRTEYVVIYTDLTPDKLGNRRKVIDVFGDVLYIDTVRSNVDLSRLYIGVDDKDLIPASLTPVIDLKPSFFRLVRLEWDAVNDGKTLVLVIGREASMRIEPPRPVDIVADHSGIKDILSKLSFDSGSRLRISNANFEVMAPVDIQGVLKSPPIVIFSGTVTTHGNTADIDVSNYTVLELEVKVTSIAGTNPALNIYVEGKFEATGDYKPLVQERITSTGAWFFTITKLAFRYIRVRWTVEGVNPSFTFIVTAQMSVL